MVFQSHRWLPFPLDQLSYTEFLISTWEQLHEGAQQLRWFIINWPIFISVEYETAKK